MFFIMAVIDVSIIFFRKSWSAEAAITPSIEVFLGITILGLRKYEKVVRVCLICLFFLTGIIMLPGGDLRCLRDLGEEGVFLRALVLFLGEFMAAAGIAVLLKYSRRSNYGGTSG